MLKKLSCEYMRKCIAPKISRAASRTGIDRVRRRTSFGKERRRRVSRRAGGTIRLIAESELQLIDRKSTRLNSSHSQISYAVFCLKKKKQAIEIARVQILPQDPHPYILM